MHVDWGWIRERSHALAEEFHRDNGFEVRVLYPLAWRRWHLTSNPSDVPRFGIPQLPFGRSVGPLGAVTELLWRVVLRMISWRWRPDAVLIPFPSVYRATPASVRCLPLFYDCMDVSAGFAVDERERARLAAAERALVREAARVFVTSEHLGRKVAELRPKDTPVLVRNGYDGWMQAAESGGTGRRRPSAAETIDLGFFGTIGPWVDQNLLIETLDRYDNVRFHMWGPLTTRLATHPHLVHHGVVAHRDLVAATAEMEAFVMPFAVSELIEGTDPVKLYEYVALGRPAISVYYPELEQFRGLVHFYTTREEFWRLVERVCERDPELETDAARAAEFLERSTWRARAALMSSAIRDGIAAHRAAGRA